MRAYLRPLIAVEQPGQPMAAPAVVRRTEVTVEREFISLRSAVPAGHIDFCQACRQQVTMLSPDSAAQAAGVTTRTMYRWIEDRLVHFSEQASGAVLICSMSLRGVSSPNQISPGEPQ